MALAFVVFAAVTAASQPVVDEAAFADVIAADQAPAATTTTSAPASGNAANPEISVITVFSGTASLEDRPMTFQAGDDPADRGFTVQEAEIAFSSDVDPYFKLKAFLAIPRLEGVEVEEAYALTTSLPANLLVKAGIFRSSFGRNNEQHLHVAEFATRPKLTALLGDDGLRAPGGQVSWLIPGLPWYATLWTEAFSLGREASGAAGLEQFFEISDSWSLLAGVNGATLKRAPEEDVMPLPPVPPRETLVGGDLYLKWKPPNVVDTYAWVALTIEGVARRTEDADEWNGAAYTSLVAQVARRVRVGARYERAAHEWNTSGSLSFLPSEYSRLALTVAHDHPEVEDLRNTYFILSLSAAIGAHGAHPF